MPRMVDADVATNGVEVDVEMRIAGESILGALVVEPGDHLVVNLGRTITNTEAQQVRDQLAARLPGLDGRVLFLNAEGMAVVRAEPDGERADPLRAHAVTHQEMRRLGLDA